MKLPLIQDDPSATHKESLGDGLYVRCRDGAYWLTSENGVEVLDQICLNPETLASFMQFLRRKTQMEMKVLFEEVEARGE